MLENLRGNAQLRLLKTESEREAGQNAERILLCPLSVEFGPGSSCLKGKAPHPHGVK